MQNSEQVGIEADCLQVTFACDTEIQIHLESAVISLKGVLDVLVFHFVLCWVVKPLNVCWPPAAAGWTWQQCFGFR